MIALPPGVGQAPPFSRTFPTAGTYYMRVCADKSSAANPGIIAESDENNNCGGWSAISVAAPAAPITNVSCSVTPTTGVVGTQYTWQASGATGGNGGPYTYHWVGTNITGNTTKSAHWYYVCKRWNIQRQRVRN